MAIILDGTAGETFSGTGMRITGDFSNATVANRVLFQTSTSNTGTEIGVLPNGSGNYANLNLYNGSDTANNSFGRLSMQSAEFRILSTIAGTGTYLPMTFYTGGSEKMRIDTSGNVGVGTSSPGAKLDVNGNITASGGSVIKSTAGVNIDRSGNDAYLLLQQDTAGGGQIRSISGGGFKFTNNGAATEWMRIDSSGNVGIGTASPGQKLDVNGNVKATGLGAAVNTGVNFAGFGDNNSRILANGSDGYMYYYGYSGHIFRDSNNNAERMRIDSSGNLLVGTASAPTGKGLVNLASNKTYQVNGTSVSALAWCSFTNSGSAATIVNSYNVSSVTYTGTGAFTVAFTNAMSNANYVVTGQAVTFGSLAGIMFTGSFSTTGFNIATSQVTTGAPSANLSQNYFVVHGN